MFGGLVVAKSGPGGGRRCEAGGWRMWGCGRKENVDRDERQKKVEGSAAVAAVAAVAMVVVVEEACVPNDVCTPRHVNDISGG